MATSKKPVQTYLDDYLDDALTKYCNDNGNITKSKAIAILLEKALKPDYLTDNDKYNTKQSTSTLPSENDKSTVLDSMIERVGKLEFELENQRINTDKKLSTVQSALLRTVESKLLVQQSKLLYLERENIRLNEINQELTERLTKLENILRSEINAIRDDLTNRMDNLSKETVEPVKTQKTSQLVTINPEPDRELTLDEIRENLKRLIKLKEAAAKDIKLALGLKGRGQADYNMIVNWFDKHEFTNPEDRENYLESMKLAESFFNIVPTPKKATASTRIFTPKQIAD